MRLTASPVSCVRICVVHFIHSVLPLAMGCCKISLPKMKRTSVLFFSYRVNCTLHDLSYQKYPHFVIGYVSGRARVPALSLLEITLFLCACEFFCSNFIQLMRRASQFALFRINHNLAPHVQL